MLRSGTTICFRLPHWPYRRTKSSAYALASLQRRIGMTTQCVLPDVRSQRSAISAKITRSLDDWVRGIAALRLTALEVTEGSGAWNVSSAATLNPGSVAWRVGMAFPAE